MSWQKTLYTKMLDGEWFTIGELFATVERDIPLHSAMRRVASTRAIEDPEDHVSITEARWYPFTQFLSQRGVECTGSGRSRFRQALNKVRLAPEGTCPVCGGATYPFTWTCRTELYCPACKLRLPKSEADIAASRRPSRVILSVVLPGDPVTPDTHRHPTAPVQSRSHLYYEIMEAARTGEGLYLSADDVAALSTTESVQLRACREGWQDSTANLTGTE